MTEAEYGGRCGPDQFLDNKASGFMEYGTVRTPDCYPISLDFFHIVQPVRAVMYRPLHIFPRPSHRNTERTTVSLPEAVRRYCKPGTARRMAYQHFIPVSPIGRYPDVLLPGKRLHGLVNGYGRHISWAADTAGEIGKEVHRLYIKNPATFFMPDPYLSSRRILHEGFRHKLPAFLINQVLIFVQTEHHFTFTAFLPKHDVIKIIPVSSAGIMDNPAFLDLFWDVIRMVFSVSQPGEHPVGKFFRRQLFHRSLGSQVP